MQIDFVYNSCTFEKNIGICFILQTVDNSQYVTLSRIFNFNTYNRMKTYNWYNTPPPPQPKF